MQAIVAVDENWGIGKDGKLLVSIPNDMKMFRKETTGKVIIMGRKTLESFPGGKPLINRRNIVLTKDQKYKKEGVEVVHSIEEALELVKDINEENVFCIGGASIYRQFLPYVNRVHVTKIDFAYEADTYFPNLDEMDDFKITATSEEQTYFDIEYYFLRYDRVK